MKKYTCFKNENLFAIANIIASNGIQHCFIVNEENEIIGVISEGDIVKKNILRNCENYKAADIMNLNPITCRSNNSLEEIKNILIQNKISCIPIISNEGFFEGIITIWDILQ